MNNNLTHYQPMHFYWNSVLRPSQHSMNICDINHICIILHPLYRDRQEILSYEH